MRGVEPAGEESLVHLTTEQGAAVVARVPAGTATWSVGDRARLQWRREDEHRFDASTGKRLG